MGFAISLCVFFVPVYSVYDICYNTNDGQQEKPSIIIPFVLGHSQGSELTVGVFFCCCLAIANFFHDQNELIT